MHSRAIALVLVSISVPVMAQGTANCNAKDSFETTRCFGDTFQRLDKELNRVYQELLKSLTRPAEGNLDYPAIRTRLVESQRLWIQFRDKDCQAFIMLNGGGTAQASLHSDCLSKRTEHRIKELREWGG